MQEENMYGFSRTFDFQIEFKKKLLENLSGYFKKNVITAEWKSSIRIKELNHRGADPQDMRLDFYIQKCKES